MGGGKNSCVPESVRGSDSHKDREHLCLDKGECMRDFPEQWLSPLSRRENLLEVLG